MKRRLVFGKSVCVKAKLLKESLFAQRQNSIPVRRQAAIIRA